MLHLLTDEHISPEVARGVLAKRTNAKIVSALHWNEGRLIGAPDPILLTHAHASGLTLVTYDQATIRPLISAWAEQGISHRGVIFVDNRSIASSNFGGLIRALLEIWDKEKNLEWKNQVVFIKKSSG